MRAFFLFLLLANLLFLAWSRWVEPDAIASREVATPAIGPLRPITLRQEAAVGPEAAEASRGAEDPQGLAAASCVSIGPYSEEVQASAASAALRRLGFESRLRPARDEVRVGFWVRVPNLATPADASNTLAVLQAAGLADASVIADGSPGNAVSVGVYADGARAAEAAARVSAAGFLAETTDRMRTLDVYWLDVDRQANGGLPALEDAGPAPEGALPLELRACPSAPVTDSTTRPANAAAAG